MPSRKLLVPVNGKKIREFREAKGWSAYKLGAKTGLSPSAIWDLERGRNRSTYHVIEIAHALGIFPTELSLTSKYSSNERFKTLKASGNKIIITIEIVK